MSIEGIKKKIRIIYAEGENTKVISIEGTRKRKINYARGDNNKGSFVEGAIIVVGLTSPSSSWSPSKSKIELIFVKLKGKFMCVFVRLFMSNNCQWYYDGTWNDCEEKKKFDLEDFVVWSTDVTSLNLWLYLFWILGI